MLSDILMGAGAGLIAAYLWGRWFWKSTYNRGKRAGQLDQMTNEQFIEVMRSIVAEIGIPQDVMIAIARRESRWDHDV